jgi:hypothetical protein
MKKTQVKAKKQATVAKKQPTAAKKKASSPPPQEEIIIALPPSKMAQIIEVVDEYMNEFRELSENNLTAMERRRKIGAGIKNYGFIDKASDLALSNPNYANFFNVQDLKNAIRNIELCRDLLVLLQSFARLVSNSMMVYSDEAYSMALLFYNNLKGVARRGDPIAMELLRALQPFFKRSKHTAAEPTAKELERDVHALIHGTKDGKIVIENEKARTIGGKHLIVDKTRSNKDKGAWKETEEEEIV